MKKMGLIIFVVIAIIFSLGVAVGNYFVDYALSPTSDSIKREIKDSDKIEVLSDAQKQIEENKINETKIGDEFKEKTKPMNTSSKDHRTLESRYLQQQEKTHNWVIVVHGYKSNNLAMMSYGAKYYEKGYNVVLPDNRAHGKSKGDYIGMGWLDKDDISCWVDWILTRDEQAHIIVHGVSMGGATTMMLSGDNIEHVDGYIEDCGYTSVWDIFASELDKRFSLPTFPILDISNYIAQMKAGYDFKDASSIEQVKKSQKPMLFIHGGKDDFVPTEMVYQVYEAAQCEKELFIVDEAGHAESKDYNPEAYWNKVFNFIDEKILIR